MIKDGIIREVYLRSTPSVDITLLKEGEEIDCRDYTLKATEYDKILDEFCENEEDRAEMFFFMLNQGPTIIR